MFLSLVFPCFNEEKSIDKVIAQALALKKELLASKKLKGMEILVVDDSSKDRSLDKLKKYEKEIRLVKLTKNQGYGFALKKGFKQSRGDWLAFCDLDDSYQAKDLSLLIGLVTGGASPLPYGADKLPIVWGNRLHKDSHISGLRAGGNRLYQALFWLLAFKNLPDPCSGLRLFQKARFWPDIQKLPDDLSFSLALSSYCLRFNIPFQTIKISYNKRRGRSKLRLFKDGWIFLYQMISYLFFKKF